LYSSYWQGQNKAERIDGNNFPEAALVVTDQSIFNISGNKTNPHIDSIDHKDQQSNDTQQQPRQPAPLTKLAAKGHKATATHQGEATHQRTDPTRPNRIDPLGDPGQEAFLQAGDQHSTDLDRCREQQEGDPNNNNEKRNNEQQKLPRATLFNGQKIWLCEALQPAELLTEAL
jgi:hypothetical protein